MARGLREMSRLAREELRHFEQVLDLMETVGVNYTQLSASRYAQGLHGLVRKGRVLGMDLVEIAPSHHVGD